MIVKICVQFEDLAWCLSLYTTELVFTGLKRHTLLIYLLLWAGWLLKVLRTRPAKIKREKNGIEIKLVHLFLFMKISPVLICVLSLSFVDNIFKNEFSD